VVREARQNDTITRKVKIQNNYNDDFELDTVSSKKGTVQFFSKKKLNDGYELELNITPPVRKGRTSHFTDTVVLRMKDGRSLEIPCNGFYPRQTTVSRVPINTTTKSSKDCKTCGPKIF
jgi:hypothetical protein